MATAPKPKFPILAKFPWLPYATGGLILLYVLFAVFQEISYQNAKVLHKTTLADVATTKPKSGYFDVSGGVMNYVFAEAVGFTNDHDKDAGSNYDSYVPYIDPQTKQVVMLVELPGYSPADFTRLVDDAKPQDQIGEFVDPASVDPKLYPMFDDRKYSIARDTPVLIQFGGPQDPTGHVITIGVIVLVLLGGAWAILYQVSKPKKRRKTFSERYPDRKVY